MDSRNYFSIYSIGKLAVIGMDIVYNYFFMMGID